MDICFKGTDNQLWGINLDGSDPHNIGGNRTRSMPVVFGPYVYFQGDDDYSALWRIKTDGTEQVNFANHRCRSAPAVTAGFVYFRGVDDALWKVTIDGSQSFRLADEQGQVWRTASTPTISWDYIFFQRTDNTLWRINQDGSNGLNLRVTAQSAPFATENFIFFQDIDNNICRTHHDGSNLIKFPDQGYSRPVLDFEGRYVWFRRYDNKVWRTNLDGSQGWQLGNYETLDAPFIARGHVFFRGIQDEVWCVRADGSDGNHVGGYSTSTTPFAISEQNQPLPATVMPHYMILTLVYAPPGSTFPDGQNTSAITYGTRSSTGTTSSMNKSFEFGTISATVPHAPYTYLFNIAKTASDTSSIEIGKAPGHEINVRGPAHDGIDHDLDVFYLWLNPVLTLSIDAWHSVNWVPSVGAPVMNIQSVTVGQLKDPSTMPGGVKQALDQAGLTPADYAAILSVNPFAHGNPSPNDYPNRYRPTDQMFPYEPQPGGSGQINMYTVPNSIGPVPNNLAEQDYAATFSVVQDYWYRDELIRYIHLNSATALTWTNISSASSTTSSSEAATLTIGSPSPGYQGSTRIRLYWDTIYKSFLFRLDA